jgi:ABC-type dipeptide/oligopeptide/nickel transport system ATPase component
MLDIRDLHVSFSEKDGSVTEAVRGIDLHMDRCELLGLVGESGSGKTVTALTVAGLIERKKASISGEILFEGRDLLRCSREELRKVQGREIGMIFQEPMTSLDPLMKVGAQIEETLRIHTDKDAAERRRLALEVMEKVGLPDPEEC